MLIRSAFPPTNQKSGKAEEIAQKLSKILGMEEEEVYRKITQNSSFVWVKRKSLTLKKEKKLRSWGCLALKYLRRASGFIPIRSWPVISWVLQVLTTRDLKGIEIMYDEQLSGIPGNIVIEFDGIGRELPQAVHRYHPSEDGNTLVLTIDETIQYVVERELDQLMNSTVRPKSATVIVMNVKTGEILALGCRPGFDPNNYIVYPQKNWRNPAVAYSYEPGSTFKIITAAAAMEVKLIKPGNFSRPGYISGFGTDQMLVCFLGFQTFGEGMENSCSGPGYCWPQVVGKG